MNELCLFAGGGGGLLATQHLLGFRTICYVEIDGYCQEVLKARIRDGLLDDAPIWDDVRTFDGRPWRGYVDIVTGGDPCQRDSNVRRYGKEPESLGGEFIRIVEEVKPWCVIRENPSRQRRDARWSHIRFRNALRGRGYDAEAVRIRACCCGADHQRARVFVLARLADTHSQYVPLRQALLRHQAAEQEAVARGVLVAQASPDFSRRNGTTDVVAHRVDRLKALGNGQVPIVVAKAWELLSQ